MIIVREKDRRSAHRVNMRERHCKMKVALESYVLELVRNLPIDGYLFSDRESDGLWYINSGKPYVRYSGITLENHILFTDDDYKTIRFIDVNGFGKMTAMPVKMCIERGFVL